MGETTSDTFSLAFTTDFLRNAGGTAIIDGGLATELERHGADLNDPLWSAKCLLTSPHLIHRVYLLSLHFQLLLSFVVSVMVVWWKEMLSVMLRIIRNWLIAFPIYLISILLTIFVVLKG